MTEVTAGAVTNYPTTRSGLIRTAAAGTRGEAREARGQLAERYGPAVRAFLRAKVKDEALADDLTQDFLLRKFLVSGRIARGYCPGTRFRHYLARALSNFAADHYRRRGCRREVGASEANEPRAARADPERALHRELVRQMLATAASEVEALCRHRGQAVHWSIFEAYYLEDPGGAAPSWELIGRARNLDGASIHDLATVFAGYPLEVVFRAAIGRMSFDEEMAP